MMAAVTAPYRYMAIRLSLGRLLGVGPGAFQRPQTLERIPLLRSRPFSRLKMDAIARSGGPRSFGLSAFESAASAE
jgi:hypothetical protein